MLGASHSQIVRAIPVLIAACHCERSAAISLRGILGVGLFLLTIVSTATAKYSGGSGTAQDPYHIATAADLIALGETPGDYDKHFILTADIDLDPNLPGRKVFDKAIVAPDVDPNKDDFQGTPFTGVFDGNGHVISHLTIKGIGYLGLFGRLEFAGVAKRLGMADANITGSGSWIGGLVGHNHGTVALCYSMGAVSGDMGVGGLVGDNGGSVIQCYSTGAISSAGRAGGLVGWNSWGGTVIQCYSTGAVRGTWEVGGLVGYNFGSVWMSLWDIRTSGQVTSAGGTGKPTAQMQDIQTYLGLGWDFVGEIQNGVSQVWQMPQEDGYPVLAIFNGYAPPQLQGLGTPEHPYLISDAMTLGAMVYNSRHAHYRLTASIDLSGIRWAVPVVPWFYGTFDGSDRTISHLTISGESGLGLFGGLGRGAVVKNLGVVDVNVTGSGPVGGLVGENSGGIVTHCYSTGAVSGRVYVGGLVGFNLGTVTQCYGTGAVSGGLNVGGLVGSNSGTVTHCYSTGAVSGDLHVGGLVGLNNGDVYYTGYGTVTQCYSMGAASGEACVGGLVGCNQGEVTQCYSTGAVSGKRMFGGLVGSDRLDRFLHDSVGASFWDAQTSGQATSVGGTGKTTAEMQTAKTFLDAAWDFVGQADGPSDIWAMPAGGGYPILWWQLSPWPGLPRFSGGSGEPNDPYAISTPEDLNSIGHNPRLMTRHFKLVADLDLTGLSFYPIGRADDPYAGVFDGSGRAISHLTIRGVNYLGLFGYLGSGAQVKDLEITDVNITGSGDHVGGLVGNNAGTVTRCYSTGAVSGAEAVGGLVGENSGTVTRCYSTGMVSGTVWDVGGLVGGNGGTVNQCYSTGMVTATGWDVGGLVGGNGGTVNQCYSRGLVSGAEAVGGLVGRNEGSVNRCYSTGMVSGTVWDVGGLVGTGSPSLLRACLWDTQTSRQTKSAGGTGKTTAQMQTAKTFLDAGWDFVGETANGTEEIWWILEGKDYPHLWWEARN